MCLKVETSTFPIASQNSSRTHTLPFFLLSTTASSRVAEKRILALRLRSRQRSLSALGVGSCRHPVTYVIDRETVIEFLPLFP